VSRALNHRPRIGEETASRIRRLAEELEYSPSLPARSLVTRDTATVGLVITCLSDPFLERLVEGVEDAARGDGYTVVLISSHRDAEHERAVVQALYDRRVTGIIVTGSQIDAGYLRLTERFRVPVVLINCPGYPHSVSTDNELGGHLAAKHLVELGHRRIAYVTNPLGSGTDLARLTGLRSVLSEHDIPPDDVLIAEGDGSLAGGARGMRNLLARPSPPTGIICFNDMTAMGAIHALVAANRSVPADCSVVGFDDLELGAYYCPPLTTVRQPAFRLGQRAMRLLLALVQGRGEAKPEILPAELVVRHSTAAAPRAA
jgi:DNA-binding LacI/PurR family transcriptional regulator